MLFRTTDPKAVAFLLAFAALLFSWALSGLAYGDASTLAALERTAVHRSDKDEDPEDRRRRLREIWAAIDGATDNRDERAWLIMTARRESGLARYVTEDEPRCSEGRNGHCDGGRAFGVWQIHRMARTETKAEQAREALRLFRAAAVRCARAGHDYWLGGTSGYASGLACEWREAAGRVAEMRAVRGRL